MRVLFLDIDGVLNGHEILLAAGCCGIDPKCVAHLNWVLERTGCKLVLSSAWRYMIYRRAMSIDGFWYMFRTHGLANQGRGNPFVGLTIRDEWCVHCGNRSSKWGPPNKDGDLACRACGTCSTRGDQITCWLTDNKEPPVERYCVVDDLDLGISAAGHPLVLTNGRLGLTRGKAKAIVELLRDD